MLRIRGGFTLLEVVVGSAILLIVSLSFILSLVYSQRMAAAGALQISATQRLQGEIERIQSDQYANITPATYPDHTPESTAPLYLDKEQRVPLTLNYDILSTFTVISATANSFTLGGIPRNAMRDGTFKPDELKGNTVVILSGQGFTQRAFINGNDANTLSITTDTSGKTQRSWFTNPNTSSVAQVNMGKIVTVRAQWKLFGRTNAEEVRTIVLPADL